MSRGMFSGFVLVWSTSPKKSPHANKKADPCKAILLALVCFELERREKESGAEIRNRRTEDRGQQAKLLTLNIHLSHLTKIYIEESAIELPSPPSGE